jgi:molybdopterin/thiamine biosynthesis adenylyltransferase/rhodanese-related sulfurtransferase
MHHSNLLSPEELNRYHRHILLSEVGIQGQEKLKKSSVLLIGAGGLGNPAGLYLAAAGVGKIGIVDDDQVELSNLQRQILYRQTDLQKSKADLTQQLLTELNPHSEITSYPIRLTRTSAMEIFPNYDWIVDASDNFPTRYLINDICTYFQKTYIYGSIFQFEGQVSVFGKKNGPCYRCLYPQELSKIDLPNCNEAGVIGVLPGLVGTLQALETIKLILNKGNTLSGRLLLINALEMKFQEFKISKDPNCLACGQNAKTDPLSEPFNIQEIRPFDLWKMIQNEEKFLLIDVRNSEEYEKAHMNGHHIPLDQLEMQLSKLDPTSPIIVHCESGVRSQKAAQILLKAGFHDVSHLRGGMKAWTQFRSTHAHI